MAEVVEERTLDTTPTWAVATVCFILILLSIIIEYLLHLLAKYFNKKRRKALIQALDKIKSGKALSIVQVRGEELQYLIFVLASFHSLSSILIFGLGMAKICFLRQFNGSVSKVDYLTLRHGFIMAHFEQGTNFDFQKYIERALEKDFGVVVGISFWIWIFSVFYIFFNAHEFYSYLWLPFIPSVLLLLVGTKLQGIITSMCLDSHDKSHVVRGTLLVKPSDHFFWFGRPKLLLHLIHFILFQNSFELAFFTWTWFKFGLRSCFHRETEDIVIRLAMGVLVHFLCGYVTLPLYALVTQMGSSMRKVVFPENVRVRQLEDDSKRHAEEAAARAWCESTVFEVDEKEEAAVMNELSNINGGKIGGEVQFPVVFVGGKLFGGLERVMATHISGELVPILKDAGALWL
ncbi:hypothetical protein GH714_016273 [Hevea brasiliensis]|uniref:MLO-like protein n=1 Tax=Hevea brasiliensis TaxID=3981 RepID=A0A6A6LSP0_HEVBR|nr:hypothetical protein GH714_016273 [Hevea brasiliensis]